MTNPAVSKTCIVALSTATMTTTNGTYMFCDADLSFSVTLTCTGPSCNSTLSQNSLTCTQSGTESWQCTNGVKCASASGFTSTFSITQTNTTVFQTQKVSMNGTSFVFQQDGAGDVTLSNGTSTTSSGGSSTAVPSSATASTASSPSSSKSGSASSRQSYSTVMLLAMLFLNLFITQTQATITGASIGHSLNAIFESLDNVGDGKTLFDTGALAIAGEFNEVAIKTCATFVGQGAGSLAGLPLAYGECEEAMVGSEMSLIGSSLGLTLRTYTGLGGANTTALTAADEAAVLAADAGAIPGAFLANSALCGLLVAVIQAAALDPASENFCSALENAALSHEPTTSSTSPSATSSSASQSPSTTTLQASPTASGVLPAGFNSNKCLECFLNTYIYSLQVLSTETCNNAAVTSASAFDLSGFFCDPDISPSYAQFCKSLCASPCAAFDVSTIIKDMGSDYIANPVTNSDQFGALCNTCSSTDLMPVNYQCASMPTCLCGIGSQLCAKGCPGVA